ncbi:MAG: TonB-dependent receptor, partial [Bacteroidota bacterium]
DNVVAGQSTSEGVEFFLRKKEGRLRGWLGYTLSRTTDQFDDLNGGEPFPNKFDRRHDFSITATYKVNEKVELSANWIYATGQAATLPIGQASSYVNSSGEGINPDLIYGPRNNFRFRDYHRLDLGVSLYKKKKWGERWWTFGVYNAYNRLNPFYVQAGPTFDASQRWQLSEVSLFPIIPSFSYRIKI